MTDLINKYNIHGALKIPMVLWFILGYGVRHIALILFPPTRIAFETFTELFISKLFLVPDALIVSVILINMARLPEASNTTRKLWRSCYWMVIAAFAIDALLTSISHHRALTDTDHLHFNYVVCNLVIDLAIIGIFLGSETIKHVFKSFPEKPLHVERTPSQQKTPANPKPKATVTKTTSNIPNRTLVKEPICPDYQLAGYPFNAGDAVDPLIRVREHLTNNNLRLAEKGLRYLLQQDPQNAVYWHELGLVAFAAENLYKAEALILKALIFDPNNYLYWRNLGEIRRRQGHIVNAIEDAQKAIFLKPDDVNAYYNLGLALWDAGQNDEALKAFEAAKQHHPGLHP